MYPTLQQHINRYVSITDADMERIAAAVQLRKYKKRQYLLLQGDPCRYDFFILSGCFKSYFTDDSGGEHVVHFGVEDWWIGDLAAFLTETTANYTVDCLEDGEVLLLEKSKLEALYLELPQLERFFRIIIQNALIANERRIIANMTQTARERYLAFQKNYPFLLQRIPDRYIASYLNMTPESLSRIRRELSQS